MNRYVPSEASKVKRGAKRASYDKQVVHEILDSHFMCHVPYVYEGTPITIPMAFGRLDETLYLHGAVGNRMLNSISDTDRISVTVTHLDGLVLARSAFHHSVNYRSAVIFGTPRLVTDSEEKNRALEIIMEHMAQGRWSESRVPNDKELKITQVLAIDITEASAKVRQGPPLDDEEDYELDLWAGVVPVKTIYEKGIADPTLKPQIEVPPSVKRLMENDERGL